MTFDGVEMPTARKRSLPAGTVNEKATGPVRLVAEPEDDRRHIGLSGGRDGEAKRSARVSARTLRVIKLVPYWPL